MIDYYLPKMSALEDLLLTDDSFSQDIRKTIRTFLFHDFDPQKHSRDILQQFSGSLTECLAQIEAGITALDGNLKNQVLEDHAQLTANITTVDLLETSLSDIVASSNDLLSSTETTINRFQALYTDYSTRLQAFEKTKRTVGLLRKAQRISQAAKRLRACLSPETGEDFGKAAAIVVDLDLLHLEVELQSLEFLQADLNYVRETVQSLPGRVVISLGDAVTTQDLGRIGLAVDACLVIGNTDEVLTGVTRKFEEIFQTLVEKGLEITQLSQSEVGKNLGAKNYPGRTTLPSAQNTPALRNAFWLKVDGIFDAIYQNQTRIELLESVYLGRYEQYALYTVDPPEIQDGKISQDFFGKMVSVLEKGLVKCGKESTFLQQMLENEFPRLLKLVKETTSRLRAVTLFLGNSKLDLLRDAVATFQSLFVSRSLGRLLGPVNSAFGGDLAVGQESLPSSEDFNGIFKAITNELVICSADDVLAALVCGNIGRALRLAFVKLESAVATDGEATQVIGSLTAKQQKNFKIIDLAFKIKFGVEKILTNDKGTIPKAAKKSMAEIVTAYEGPVKNVLKPLIDSLADSVESILLTMHDEDFSVGEEDSHTETVEILDSTCSRYMRELQDFLARVQHTFFSQIDITQPLLRQFVVGFVRRCLELFIRHTSLVRPVGKQGRLKLAGDFAQLEAALAPLNLKTSEYGRELAIAKAFRPLLFQSPLQISENSSAGKIVPYSVVLHHLFSRAPADLQSPFKVSRWSISRYSRFLDDHPLERDRLLVISSCLDAYAQAVRNRGETHYAVIFPLMKDILTKALQDPSI